MKKIFLFIILYLFIFSGCSYIKSKFEPECNFDDGVYYGMMVYSKMPHAPLEEIISQAECDCLAYKE